uniref:Uncharacterized protein n=1 Tax=Timema bartmani TaxID=61472 RepID=A0A7R9HVW7_9NEOP|nr:unnamed protein product [Timema bartmani]
MKSKTAIATIMELVRKKETSAPVVDLALISDDKQSDKAATEEDDTRKLPDYHLDSFNKTDSESKLSSCIWPNDSGESNVDEPETDISHVEGAMALERVLLYIEQHSKPSPPDVMFMKCWQDIVVSLRRSALR